MLMSARKKAGSSWLPEGMPALVSTSASSCMPREPRCTWRQGLRQVNFAFSSLGLLSHSGFYLTLEQEKAEKAIEEIVSASDKKGRGVLKFLQFDLLDLKSVKAAAEAFAAQETRLDVLWNNAGFGGSSQEPGAKTAQGLNTYLGAHCVAHLFLAELLLPQLRAAAECQPAGSVRVIWCSSHLAELIAPKGGVDMELVDGTGNGVRDYAISKAGNWILGLEYARRRGNDAKVPILSLTQNPGNANTNALAGSPRLIHLIWKTLILHDPKLAAYTELYAGLSPELTMENQGDYIMPWGRVQEKTPRQDFLDAAKPVDEGGQGLGAKFWDWCEEQWKGI